MINGTVNKTKDAKSVILSPHPTLLHPCFAGAASGSINRASPPRKEGLFIPPLVGRSPRGGMMDDSFFFL
ncbi:hypothetical protein D3OALGA1CA_4198 [Olavius algarvensis associated proteobacterium Delta 3]|nr:hypothetical protein D3OALGA1CA_4198 [Olavius algarvensis associated proteobacterium Delta 3]